MTPAETNRDGPQVVIHTDGACTGNPGPGGYAAVLESGGRRREVCGGFRRTTNNRMELMAAIAALEALRRPCQVTLCSDSKYVVDAMTQGWPQRWKARGWRRADRAPARNPDLWDRLLTAAARHRVDWRWVRGHAGHAENENCDRLAVREAARPNLPEDAGFEPPDPASNGLFLANS